MGRAAQILTILVGLALLSPCFRTSVIGQSPGAAGQLALIGGTVYTNGKPVFVHPTNGSDVLAAIRAGVDVIAHTTPSSGPWDDTILTAMKERRVALTPTLAVWKDLLRHDRISTQEQSVRTSIGQLRAWVASKVPFCSEPISAPQGMTRPRSTR